jgi:hypothetical protein
MIWCISFSQESPSIFETSDGRFFLISSNGEQRMVRDGQFFQTPDGRLFRIDAMTEGKEEGGLEAANEVDDGGQEKDDRLSAILDRIRIRAKEAKVKDEARDRTRQRTTAAAEKTQAPVTEEPTRNGIHQL